jgi:hypothetical protein
VNDRRTFTPNAESVTLGWGIGISLNAWDTYMRHPITEDDVQREMRHLEAR